MRIPSNKNIAFISVPPTFVEETRCPLGIIPIGVLKIVSLLKEQKNNVEFINMHAGLFTLFDEIPHSKWKMKRMGLRGSRHAEMCVAGKGLDYLEEKLRELSFSPDEIWISCSFSFDYDLVKEYVDISRKIYPNAKISAGGDFARAGHGIGQMTGADEICEGRIAEADACLPDFSCVPEWKYGLFQLQIGCVNKCSFCHISMDKPQFYDTDKIINYMKEFYDRYHPMCFHNWDPNVALNRPQLTDFLEKYAASGMEASITFGKGLQPNLVDDKIMRLMAKARVNSVTIPLESSSYEAWKRLSKPYSIISSVKLLASAKNAGIPMHECICTSLLGYPDDDLHSFFRLYLTVLSFGALPAPFPVFLFPGAPDYLKYKDILGDKDVSEFHGQLWPLLPDEKIDDYLRLYKFIELTDIQSIQKNISLLSPEMRNALSDEAGRFRKYIERCLNAKKDTAEEFRKISEDMDSSPVRMPLSEKMKNFDEKMKKQKKDAEILKTSKKGKKTENAKKTAKKRKLLCLIANPASSRRSVSKAMGEYYLRMYKSENPDAEITRLDLSKEGLPFINEEYVDYVYYKDSSKELSPETKKLFSLAEKFSKQLMDADDIVIISPMYTLSIPAMLKAYFETVASYSYYYKNNEMFNHKNVLCIISRDGTYPKSGRSDGKPAYLNVQESILAAALEFLGLSSNPDFIAISNLFSRKDLPKTIADAKKKIELYAKGDKAQAYNLF